MRGGVGGGSFLTWKKAQLQETIEMYEVFQGPCPEMALFHLCSHVIGQSRLQGQGHSQGLISALCVCVCVLNCETLPSDLGKSVGSEWCKELRTIIQSSRWTSMRLLYSPELI